LEHEGAVRWHDAAEGHPEALSPQPLAYMCEQCNIIRQESSNAYSKRWVRLICWELIDMPIEVTFYLNGEKHSNQQADFLPERAQCVSFDNGATFYFVGQVSHFYGNGALYAATIEIIEARTSTTKYFPPS
jgi:hypothetical protein